MRKLFYILCFLFLIASQSFSATYWVDDNGAETTWANCQSESPLSGSSCCTMATANTNADDDDIVYLRAGTYTFTGNFIGPTNSGSSGHVVTFSGYDDEAVTVTGSSEIAGYNSIGINLDSDSYIKVTGIDFTNVQHGFVINAGGHNEISYCTFAHRNGWNDILLEGTAENTSGNYENSTYVLYDTSENLSSYNNKRIFNVTDGSVLWSIDSVTADTASGTSGTTRVLDGGTNNYWSNGDSYQITHSNTYDPAPCDIGGVSTHNWIHHNEMWGPGGFTSGQDGVPVFQIGGDQGSAEANNYNTIEYNHFYKGGHHTAGFNKGHYNVIRGNYFTNEAWFDDSSWTGQCYDVDYCGYRVVTSGVDDASYGGDSLWENNRIGHGAAYGGHHIIDDSSASGGGVSLATPNNVYRFNEHIHNALYGLRIGSSIAGAANDNKIYNNTFYKNGYGADDDPRATNDNYRSSFLFYQAGTTGIVIKNNLFYDTWSYQNTNAESKYYGAITENTDGNADGATISNNYMPSGVDYFSGSESPITDVSDPLFVNSSLPAEDAEYATAMAVVQAWPNTVPNLSLQSGSPAIGGGTYLTTVDTDDSGSGTTLEVVDSSYFQDGTWGSSLADLAADYICVGLTVAGAECVQISSITDSDTIELSSGISRSDNDYVWLQRKSDGEQVLYGDAPEYGAYEYQPTATISGTSF
jgi:hypothetical protein